MRAEGDGRAQVAEQAAPPLALADLEGLVGSEIDTWAPDNRTCSLRVVGHGPSLHFENRAGGSDLNPYLALSAIVAAGLHGVESGLALEDPYWERFRGFERL